MDGISPRVFTLTLASATTLTGASQELPAYKKAYLEIPTFATATRTFLQAANATSGTYRRVCNDTVNTATAETNDWAVASAFNNRIVPLPAGLGYVKVEVGTALADGASFKIICS